MAGALQPGRTKTNLNGTTPVTLVAAPAVGWTRTVLSLRITNRDSVAKDIMLQHNDGGGATELERRSGLAVNAAWKDAIDRDTPIILTSTDSLLAVMGTAITTTAPTALASWIDRQN